MTCILGARTHNGVWLGGDRGLFDLDSGDVSTCGESKLWKCGDFVIGGAGSSKDLQILQYQIDYGKLNMLWRTNISYPSEHFLVRNLIPMVEARLDGRDKDFSLLIALVNELFVLQEDCSIVKLKNKFEAIGSGGEYAVGAMENMKNSNMKMENKIIKALHIASKYNVFIRGPYDVLTTHKGNGK